MLPKIQTRQEKEEKERKSKIWMTVLVVVILGASTAAYAVMETSGSQKKTYNGFTFTQTENGWQAKKMSFVTSYLPQDVENITLNGDLSLDDFSGTIYINALGSTEVNAANELIRTLPAEKAVLSCSPENENETFCAELPIMSCDDAAYGSPVIVFEQSNETSIDYDDYCLVINADNENSLKAIDRIIFSLYGIMET